MCRQLVYSIVITLSVTLVFVTGLRPWVTRVHQACFAGHPLKNFRTGWRSRCESNAKPGDNLPLYQISSVTNAITKARSKIWFGPPVKAGRHPESIHYDSTMNAVDAMCVSYAWNESIFMEATDFGTEYYIQVKTPNKHQASCYKLLKNKKCRNMTLARDPKC